MSKLSDDIQRLVDRCPVCAGSGVKPGNSLCDALICQANMCTDLLTIKRRVIALEAKTGAYGPSPAPEALPAAANPDLAMPKGLSELGQLAYRTIIDTAAVFGLTYTGGCKAFYSPKEWRERGEAYGHNSELIIVYDGGDIGCLFGLDKDEMSDYAHVDSMREALAEYGLYTEEGTCWYSAVYKSRP